MTRPYLTSAVDAFDLDMSGPAAVFSADAREMHDELTRSLRRLNMEGKGGFGRKGSKPARDQRPDLASLATPDTFHGRTRGDHAASVEWFALLHSADAPPTNGRPKGGMSIPECDDDDRVAVLALMRHVNPCGYQTAMDGKD